MNKDKEWAQKEVDRYLSYEGVNEARNALVFAKGVIDQLDEPEIDGISGGARPNYWGD
ncbi:hypothetical protein HYO62_00355 [Aerococcaceae bacterium DSM 111022]|nr:hypothetical protein [Aerococcaceae bacterium DSM 111022]